MAWFAKCHQVFFVMCSTLGERLYMMDMFCSHKPSFLPASLTERMVMDVSVTNNLPSSPVPFLCFLVPSVALVLPVHLPLVLLAVPSLCQVGTAGISTWSLWFSRHFILHSKSPGLIRGLGSFYFFRQYNNNIGTIYHSLS